MTPEEGTMEACRAEYDRRMAERLRMDELIDRIVEVLHVRD